MKVTLVRSTTRSGAGPHVSESRRDISGIAVTRSISPYGITTVVPATVRTVWAATGLVSLSDMIRSKPHRQTVRKGRTVPFTPVRSAWAGGRSGPRPPSRDGADGTGLRARVVRIAAEAAAVLDSLASERTEGLMDTDVPRQTTRVRAAATLAGSRPGCVGLGYSGLPPIAH